MKTSALQASGSCEKKKKMKKGMKKDCLLHLRKGQECACCMTETSFAPDAGLAVASSFSLDRAVTPSP